MSQPIRVEGWAYTPGARVSLRLRFRSGGLAELEEYDEGFVIRGYGCPLAAVTPGHPEVCRIAEALIEELAGVPVYETCDRGAKPRCCFEVVPSESTTQE